MHQARSHPPLDDLLDKVESEVRRVWRADDGFLGQAARTALSGRGKRLRPGLLLLAAESVGDATETTIALAAAVEVIHTASLVHDDVLDDSSSRRGRRSANALWGNKRSVLLGDYLVARAFDLLPAEQRDSLVPEIVEVATRMCQGQVRELRTAGRWPTEEEYLAILEGKTGALFDFCGRAGARSAGGSPREVDLLGQFGAGFGVAYQMADDILDLVGSEGQSGKPEGVDLTQGKLTLPLILAAAEAPPELRGELDRIVSARRVSPADIERAREIVHSTQATDRAWSRVSERLAWARAALDSLPETPARDALLAMAGDEFPMPVMA